MRIRGWNYSSMEPLYRGPLGVVNKARCESKGGRFDAVTRLDPELPAERLHEALDARMARVGSLRSPLLIRDKGLVEVDGQMCLASVLVDGVPLSYVVGLKPLPPRAACGLAGEVARALHVAFDSVPRRKKRAHGLVHGDLTPDDIIIGEHGEVRVANLGRKPGRSAASDAVLRAGVRQADGWRAPEFSADAPDHVVDVYSLAAILSWMVTGVRPPGPLSDAEAHGRMVADRVAAVVDAAGEQAVGDLVAWGMRFDATARPTASTLAGFLGKLQRALPGSDRRSAVADRMSHARGSAIEAMMDDDIELGDCLVEAAVEPSVSMDSGQTDWGESVEGLFDENRAMLQRAVPPHRESRRPARVSTVASIVVDPSRWQAELGGVVEPEDGPDDITTVDPADEQTVGPDDDDIDLEAFATMELDVPEAFGSLREVSLEASAGDSLELELDDEGSFALDDEDLDDDAADGGAIIDDEADDSDASWEASGASIETGVPSGGVSLRIGVGGGRGVSSAGRDDLTGVSIPEHLFRDADVSPRRVPPPVREAPVRTVRLTMPVHEDNLDGFVFMGSEEDAIAATQARAPKVKRPDPATLQLDSEDEPTEEASGPVVPVAPAASKPEAPSYAPPRPLPPDAGNRAFLWAVGLGGLLIVAIIAAAPFIQSWRQPLPPPPDPLLPAPEAKAEPSPLGSPAPDAPSTRATAGDRAVEAKPATEPPASAKDASPARPRGKRAIPPPPLPPASKRSTTTRSAGDAPPTGVPASQEAPAAGSSPPPPPPSAPAPTGPEPEDPSEAGEDEAPSAAPTGRIVVEGDAHSVRFLGSGGAYEAGPVPPGTYQIEVVFAKGASPMGTGSLHVAEESVVTVRCSAAFFACNSQ